MFGGANSIIQSNLLVSCSQKTIRHFSLEYWYIQIYGCTVERVI